MEANTGYTNIKISFEDGKTERDMFLNWVGWVLQISDEGPAVILEDAKVGVLVVRNWNDDTDKPYGESFEVPLDQIRAIHVY